MVFPSIMSTMQSDTNNKRDLFHGFPKDAMGFQFLYCTIQRKQAVTNSVREAHTIY